MSQALKHLREQHCCHICHGRCTRVCTQTESVQGPCEKFPSEAGKCSLWIRLHLLTVPRAEPGAVRDRPRTRRRSGITRGQQRGEIPAGRGPTPREVLVSAAGARRAPRVSFWITVYRAPRDGLQSQPRFILATLRAGNSQCKCENRDVVPFREVK